MQVSDFKDKTVLVMGLGTFGGGLDVARFAARRAGRTVVTDMAGPAELAGTLQQLEGLSIEYHLGGHEERDFGPDGADIIVVNPAVPPGNRFLQIARDAGRTLTSQMEIFFQLCPAPIIGITGANGKSTTTALTHHLLSAGGRRVWLGGNIGNQPLLTEIDEIQADHLVVLELSSFQLEQLARIQAAPKVALITNLTPNHLDRHGTFEAYCDAKENIFRHQSLDPAAPAVSIFNAEDPITLEWSRRYANQPGRIVRTFEPEQVPDAIVRRFPLAGRANLSNLAAALQVARHFGLSDDRLAEQVASFRALPHRLELVAEVAGVRWYDDSIATTPPSAIAALDGFDEPKIIIAGGYDKGLPFDEFGQKIASCAKAAVLIGKTAAGIAEQIARFADPAGGPAVRFAATMPEAVRIAAELAASGDIVLMSPACASYDMFDNFRHRAQVFRQAVADLASL